MLKCYAWCSLQGTLCLLVLLILLLAAAPWHLHACASETVGNGPTVLGPACNLRHAVPLCTALADALTCCPCRYDKFSFDITQALQNATGSSHELLVEVTDPSGWCHYLHRVLVFLDDLSCAETQLASATAICNEARLHLDIMAHSTCCL